MDKKVCSRCRVEKDVLDFYRKKSNADGLLQACKQCIVEDSMKYYHKNKAQIIGKQRIYKKANRMRARQLEQIRRDHNKSEIRRRQFLYRVNNRDKIKEAWAKYSKKNRTLLREKSKEYEKSRRGVDRRKEYYEKNSLNISKRLKIWRKENPDKIQIYKRKSSKNRIRNLTKKYVRERIGSPFGLSAQQRLLIPDELIQLKRLSLTIKRELKNIKQ